MSNETIAFIGVLLFMAVVGISAMYFISKYPTDGVTAMSDEPKCTDALQAEIAQQYRNINSKPGLEIGLRPELGTYELCDKHYDASRTEAAEHCAVCQLQAQLAELREEHKRNLNQRTEYAEIGHRCSWRAAYEAIVARSKAALLKQEGE